MSDGQVIGILPLARATFDVAYSRENLAHMIAALERSGHSLAGPRDLLFDADAARDAMTGLREEKVDQILVLQVTFTDAAMIVEIAAAFEQPLSIWAIPEPRTGGMLRLNSFCGLNLAGHALGLNERAFSYLYGSPAGPGIDGMLQELFEGKRKSEPVETIAARSDHADGRRVAAALRGARIGRIGAHPDGFDTCAYDAGKLDELAGISVDELDLPDLFGAAANADAATADALRADTAEVLAGLDKVDQQQLDRSLRLKPALDMLRDKGKYDAFAVRCWPETFSEYGGAVCGPVSMMGEARVPCACEADVYGALTSLVLQEAAGAPAFLTDLVDLDVTDNTGVVWHCGQAPISMADPGAKPRAAIHNNRKMPLLFEFPLKPGRVTFFRLSQARGRTCAVIGGGEMLERPLAFTGTAGVVRFDSGSQAVLDRVMGGALEHHMALAYGDHRAVLEAAAAELGLQIMYI